MAGSHSSRMFTMVEVLHILDEDDNINEPICDESDGDFGMLEEVEITEMNLTITGSSNTNQSNTCTVDSNFIQCPQLSQYTNTLS